jgi:UDP:flavonoid glycosyltransferase YjiC (YdhE family)
MVPLAWAMRAAGHDVLIATSGSALATAEAGLPVVDFAPGDAETAAAMPRLVAENPHIAWARIRSVEDGWSVMAETAKVFAAPMIAVAERWQPDLIIHSQLQGAGMLAGATLGVPTVEHGFGLLRTGAFHDRLKEFIPEEFARHGVAGPPACRVVIDVAPPSVVAAHNGAWQMRFVPYNGGGVLPEWLRDLPDRPRIAVTVGTAGLAPDAGQFIGRILAAAADVDAEFIVLGNITGRAGTQRAPANVRIQPAWVPLRELLDRCSAVIHHGGGGSMMTAFDAGIPQLSVPAAAPNYLQSVAMQDRGVGFWTDLDAIDAAAVERLLRDEKLREAASEVRAEMAAMPAPAAIVPRLTDLVR